MKNPKLLPPNVATRVSSYIRLFLAEDENHQPTPWFIPFVCQFMFIFSVIALLPCLCPNDGRVIIFNFELIFVDCLIIDPCNISHTANKTTGAFGISKKRWCLRYSTRCMQPTWNGHISITNITWSNWIISKYYKWWPQLDYCWRSIATNARSRVCCTVHYVSIFENIY